MKHETTWIPEVVGAATTLRGCVTGRRHERKGGGPPLTRRLAFGVPMEGTLAEGWQGILERQTRSGEAAKARGRRVSSAPGDLVGRSARLRILHRFLDPEAHRESNSQRIRREIQHHPCMARLASFWMVLSGPGATRHAKRRRGHCSLEAVQVAAYKKKPDDLGPTWFSSMRAAFSLSRRGAEPGGLKATDRWSGTITGMIASLPWPPFRSRPFGSAWVSTFVFSGRISRRRTSLNSCGGFCNIWKALSSCSGIREASIKVPTFARSVTTIPAFILSLSPNTLPNSILRNKSGRIGKAEPPTASIGTRRTFKGVCIPMRAGCVAPKVASAPLSWLRSFQDPSIGDDITYAKRNSTQAGSGDY